MNTFTKFALAAAVTGAVALSAVTPGQARDGRNTAAVIGFGAGALVGAAVASNYNNGYYGNSGYYANDGYYGNGYRSRSYYNTGYAYAPAPVYSYDDDYAYAPAPVYRAAPRYRTGNTWERTCGGNPGKSNYVPCGN